MAKYKCLSDGYPFCEKGVTYDFEFNGFSSAVETLAKRFPEDWELIPEFNKGDVIQVSNSGEIWRERIFQGMYNDKYVDCDFKIWNHAKKKPLLVTEDGVELFDENDIVHYYNEDIDYKCTTDLVGFASELTEGTKFFSTSEARQLYIDSIESKYVPFTAEDNTSLLGRRVKVNEALYIITGCTKDGIYAGVWCSHNEAFDQLKFIDGSPFGKQVK